MPIEPGWLLIFIKNSFYCSSVQFSRSVVSDSLRPHGLQHTRLPYPSPSPGVCPSSCSLHQWCHPANSSSYNPLLLPSNFPSIRDFSNQLPVGIRWPKYWSFSFSISPYSEYSGLISLKIVWFDLLAVQGTFRVFSSTAVQRHHVFGTLLSLRSCCHNCMWPLGRP